MNCKSVTVRLLDSSLHKFLPTLETILREIYETKLSGKIEGISEKEVILKKIKELMEVNTMIRHRSIRLDTTNPEIYEIQIRTFFEAIVETINEDIPTHAEVMIQNVTEVN